MTDNVDDLIKLSLNKPVRLFLDKNTAIASKLTQEFIRVRSHKEVSKPAMLAALCARTYREQTIVFFASKAAAHRMKIVFGLLGLKAAELHGNLTQLQRLEALDLFRERKVDFLLATDLAARGLDISGIKTVINYDMPTAYTQYVHRVGRTARGSKAGKSVSFVAEGDRILLKQAIKSSTEEVKHRVIPAEVIARFQEAIKGLENSIQEIIEEEKAEKDIQQAEMQVARAENMIKYHDEIKSRPARTWFQTEKEKKAAKEPNPADIDKVVFF
ncbi:nucleolar DEAD-box protein required for synthesis of 60S ribosomal subunit [Dinochytrium kinnereticum]|nr:nucleolar DEAD-box protein required for synthesis of 60S ribosomal subunit [Dinochytrium kinnereticum]